MQPAAPVANEHERAPGAEEIAGGEQRDDQQPAIVHPGEDRREIAGRDVGTEEAVQDDDRGGQEQDELQGRARVSPRSKRPTSGQRRTSAPAVASPADRRQSATFEADSG